VGAGARGRGDRSGRRRSERFIWGIKVRLKDRHIKSGSSSWLLGRFVRRPSKVFSRPLDLDNGIKFTGSHFISAA
jgi:hypothetical protein